MNAPMKCRLPQSWTSYFLAVGVGLVMIALFFGLTRVLGFTNEDIYSELARLESERSREEDLVIRDRAFVENIEGKKRVIKATLEGRLTLHEAAAQFQNLNLLCPEYDWQNFRRLFPGRTDEERHCRQVLACLKQEAGDHSPPAYELVARLEREFEREIT